MVLCFDRAIKRSDCFHENGKASPCHYSSYPYMIMFGLMEVFLSQIPDFDQIWWLSIVAAVMSFTYSAIGLGLGVAQVAGLGLFLLLTSSEHKNYFHDKKLKLNVSKHRLKVFYKTDYIFVF